MAGTVGAGWCTCSGCPSSDPTARSSASSPTSASRPTRVVDGVFPRLVVDGLVVDGKHVGSMLGYDRRAEQGPWLLRRIVRHIHRNAGYLPWDAVEEVDWDAGVVRVRRSDLDPLDVATR